jgi:Ca-activated chloride channel family protein
MAMAPAPAQMHVAAPARGPVSMLQRSAPIKASLGLGAPPAGAAELGFRAAAPAAMVRMDPAELGLAEEEPSYCGVLSDDVAHASAEDVPAGPAGDRLAALFGQQLANGLWEGDEGSEQGQLVATMRALVTCVEAGVDSNHPVYGSQVRKAVEAICALAVRIAAMVAPPGVLGAALDAAQKTAGGRRLREQVKATISQLGLS